MVSALISIAILSGANYKVTNSEQYNTAVKKLLPGDSLVLVNGVWKDVMFKFKGEGEPGKYIYLVAETPGKVTIEGKSKLQLSGKYLYVSGLVFINGSTPKNSVIEFRTGSADYAYNSVVSECVIDHYNQQVKDSDDHWIDIYGKKNTVEYCYFGGKNNQGTTMVIWPNDSNSIDNGHLIYRNYFGPRPRLGANGGETIRIGTSHVCHLNSASIVDGNYFEHCNGEVEIISNKSGNNKLVNNTFYECEGSLVLRHGDNALVSGNWFIGNGKPFTGGVRVINEGHKIYNNYFYKLTGDDFRSGLAVMNGIPDSPANGYAPVKNVIVANNTYYDCAYTWAFGIGSKQRNRTVRPENMLLLNNLVYAPNSTDIVKFDDICDGVKFDNNLIYNSNGIAKELGGVAGDVNRAKVNNIDFVYTAAKAKKLPFVKYDILGRERKDVVIGAFQNLENPAIEMATSANCGPAWYKPLSNSVKAENHKGKTIQVDAGTDNLYKAVKKAGTGDILVLSAGEHIITNKIRISKDLTITSADPKNKAIIRLKSSRGNNSCFEIGENAQVYISNVDIDGDSKAEYPAKYAFITSKESAFGYKLIINNCEIHDFKVESGSIFKAYKGSVADSVVIKNSYLHDAFRGFSLADEKDDIGKYNAETVVFDNTVFKNFTQYLIDYYRGGNDESTLGGNLQVDHCVFDRVADDEKQTMLKTNGIVTVNIANSIFCYSLAKQSVRLSGEKNTITNCCFYDCTDVKISNGAQSQTIVHDAPKFEKKSYTLSKKSKLAGMGTDNSNIGLR